MKAQIHHRDIPCQHNSSDLPTGAPFLRVPAKSAPALTKKTNRSGAWLATAFLGSMLIGLLGSGCASGCASQGCNSGSMLRAGIDPATSGELYQPGNGVSTPELIREVKPNYTGDAMRAKLQGIVEMEAVVMPDGSVGRVRITHSLDKTFGLDDEAIKAVKQWRFKPGMLRGQPVAVLVNVELTFTLKQ
jgi:TonB family protein